MKCICACSLAEDTAFCSATEVVISAIGALRSHRASLQSHCSTKAPVTSQKAFAHVAVEPWSMQDHPGHAQDHRGDRLHHSAASLRARSAGAKPLAAPLVQQKLC